MHLLFRLAFAINIALTLAGFALLVESPYTGLQLSVCGESACVKRVERDAPAHGRLQAGDTLVSLDGERLPPLVFHEDPDYIRLARDQAVFWDAAQEVDRVVRKDRPLNIAILRDGHAATVTLTPVGFPLARALQRTVPIYLVGWTFLILAVLVYRKKQVESAQVFGWVAILVCIDWAAGAPFTVRDLVFPYPAFLLLSKLDLVSALFLVATFVHLALVFPRRILPPALHRPVVFGLYAAALALIVARTAGWMENTFLASYTAFSTGLALAMAGFAAQYWREKSPALRRQVKWVLFSALASSLIYVSLSAFPAALGTGFVSVALSGLAFILIPVSFAFAITRYRLLDIENILDNAVVYGFTLAVLVMVESTLLALVTPSFVAGERGLPYSSVLTVLLIVFIYLPVRNTVRRMVERLFKRGTYDVEQELRRFAVALGLTDAGSPLDTFATYVQGLLSPEDVVVLRIAEHRASLVSPPAGVPARLVDFLLTHAEAIWARMSSTSGCVFGYDIQEQLGREPVPAGIENALFLPLISDAAGTSRGYLAVLLKKQSGTGYSRKDVTLLNALASNLAGAIEAGELRKERDALEERFAREKDAVMKELHDGLGNILTSVIVSSQAAEKLCHAAPEAGKLVRRIEDFSIEAMNFMRTGLTVLDHPKADLGTMMGALGDRFVEHFAAVGIDLTIECAPEAGRLRPGGAVVMNLTRILQEALGNIIKHAGASRARISLEAQEGQLEITIVDNGTGFADGGSTPGHGLQNLRRRVEVLQGSMVLAPASEQGVLLRFVLPVTCG